MSILKNRTIVGIICIIVALVICFGITPLFNKSISQKIEIVRVTSEIKTGDEITKDMVQSVEVGSYNLPANVIYNKDDIVGKYASADFSIGDYILTTKVSDTPAADNAGLYNLDGLKQAMSISIKSFANGLSGKLQSGDIVSIIVPNYMGSGVSAILPELQYVEILTVTASSGIDTNTEEVSGDEKELPSTVTVLVTPEQSKILAELELTSKIHLSLVYRGSAENASRFLEAQDDLLELLYPEPIQAEDSVESERDNGTGILESEAAPDNDF